METRVATTETTPEVGKSPVNSAQAAVSNKSPVLRLEIDHADGAIDTWDLQTLRLAHKSCNVSNQKATAATSLHKKKRFRAHPQLYAFTYRFLVQRDGEKCYYCGKGVQDLGMATSAQEDKKRILEGEAASETGIPTGYAPIDLSRQYEPQFRLFMYNRTQQKEPLYSHEAIYDGAEVVGCSPQASREYLNKLIAPHGLYEKCPPVKVGKQWKTQIVRKPDKEILRLGGVV